MWRGWSTWKPPRNRVSKTRFLIGLFQNLMHFVSNASPLSLALSLSHSPTHSHSPSHSFTHRPTLSVTLSTLTQTPCHALYSLTHPLHSHSISTLSLHYFTFISFAKRTEIVSNAHHRALISFSLRNLWKKKKKGWVPLCKMQSVFHRLVAEKQWEKSKKLWFQFVFFFFFLFWFLFWISNRILKKIETLLFFEIELVCGIGLCFWVCLYLLRF